MRVCPILLLIWLALLSRVSAERPQTVIATIPSEGLLQNVAKDGSDGDEEGRSRAMIDLEVTGFITKSGDIFELPLGRSMGSIEAREEPELEPGMTMCRYGTIVVYSDSDCNTFFRPSEALARPLTSKIQNANESEGDDDSGKPAKKKGKKRKPNKNKKRNQKNRQKQQRRKAAALRKKKQQNQKRRRNKLKNGGNNSQRKNNKKRVNKNRRGNNFNKRRRINKGEWRSDVTAAPLQFTVLLNRH